MRQVVKTSYLDTFSKICTAPHVWKNFDTWLRKSTDLTKHTQVSTLFKTPKNFSQRQVAAQAAQGPQNRDQLTTRRGHARLERPTASTWQHQEIPDDIFSVKGSLVRATLSLQSKGVARTAC